MTQAKPARVDARPFSATHPSRSASTASSVRDRTPYLSNMRRRWLSTVFSVTPRRTPISSFDAPPHSSTN